MKLISNIIKSLINHSPYLLLIATYFFFVNLEAVKDTDSIGNIKKEAIQSDEQTNINIRSLRIKIPVIPYNE